MATEYLVKERQANLRYVGVVLELFDLAQLVQVTIPERIPLLCFFRRRDMELPMHTNALATAKRAEESLDVLIFALKFAAMEARECSITHDA